MLQIPIKFYLMYTKYPSIFNIPGQFIRFHYSSGLTWNIKKIFTFIEKSSFEKKREIKITATKIDYKKKIITNRQKIHGIAHDTHGTPSRVHQFYCKQITHWIRAGWFNRRTYIFNSLLILFLCIIFKHYLRPFYFKIQSTCKSFAFSIDDEFTSKMNVLLKHWI